MKAILRFVVLMLCPISTIQLQAYTATPSKAKAAYLSSNVTELVNMAVTGNTQESIEATDYIALMDLSQIDYLTLCTLTDQVSTSQNEGLKSLMTQLLQERQLSVISQFRDMTAEELVSFNYNNLHYSGLTKDYINTLSQGLDSLNYQELRYLRLKCPLFDKTQLSQYSKKRIGEVMPILEEQMKQYRDIEIKSMEWFTSAISYEIMEGLLRQIKQFAIAYSMDENMEESQPSNIYNSYMELLRQYWTEGVIYDYVLAQTKNYNEGIDNARAELLKNLGINGRKQNIIQIPTVDMGITLGLGGFQKMGNIRSELNGTEFGASVVAGLASFLTGGLISSVGKSIYMSGEKEDAARQELPHRRSYLIATFDKLQAQTEKELKKMTKDMMAQQIKQSQSFYDYVIQNY